MSLTKSQEKAIRDYVLQDVDDETKRLIRLANWDLYYGPVTEPDDGEPWPGFSVACRRIRDALDIGTLYLNEDFDEVTDVEPEWINGWVADRVWQIERETVLSIVVGRELASYIR